MSLRAADWVSIGTTSPASTLSVGGAGLAGVSIYSTGSSTTATQGTIYGANNSATTGNGVYGAMTASGNTGAGVYGTNVTTGVTYP